MYVDHHNRLLNSAIIDRNMVDINMIDRDMIDRDMIGRNMKCDVALANLQLINPNYHV